MDENPTIQTPKMEFLGSTSVGGACPTLYRLPDGRIVVQGDMVTDPALIGQARDILPSEGFLVVPAALGEFWPVIDV